MSKVIEHRAQSTAHNKKCSMQHLHLQRLQPAPLTVVRKGQATDAPTVQLQDGCLNLPGGRGRRSERPVPLLPSLHTCSSSSKHSE
jgi:hypothetical protein